MDLVASAGQTYDKVDFQFLNLKKTIEVNVIFSKYLNDIFLASICRGLCATPCGGVASHALGLWQWTETKAQV